MLPSYHPLGLGHLLAMEKAVVSEGTLTPNS